MNLLFMQNDLVLAICWTLIHSLWQGLLLAVIIGVVMVATRKSNARKRYDLLTLLFFVFTVATVITFVRELHMVSANAGAESVSQVFNTNQASFSTLITGTGNSIVIEKNGMDRFKDYFDQHASLIVAIWFVIFIARFIRLTANLIYVQRLKNYKTYPAPEIWTNKIKELISLLGIRGQIRLLESGIVKVPVVMGMFKPVILLPLGLLAHLPADEIEAILLHELAHIQRRDYFVNLLQSILETIFFFNPAVMWLSSMIREERENCCDDIAISITNNRTQFINALISFQEYNLAGTACGVGFPGEKNHLLNRVKRIISERNKTLNATEKSILTFGMAVLIMFSFVAAKKVPVTDFKKNVKTNLQAAGVTYKRDKSDLSMPVADDKNISFSQSQMKRDLAEPVLQSDLIEEKISDTVPPATKKMNPDMTTGHAYSFAISDTAKYFSSFSTSINDDGHTRTMRFNATTSEGKRYRIKKVNDIITEFYINDEQVPESQFEAHKAEIEKIESTYRYKQERANERKALALIKRKEFADERHAIQEMNRANLKLRRDAEMQERTIENIKREASRRISEGKGRALDSNERLDFNRRVIKFKSLADSLKRTVATDQQKMGLQNKQIALEKLSKLKARMQFGDSTQKLNLAEQKLLLEIQSNLAEVQRLKLSRPDLPETKINLDLKRQSLQLRRTADSLQRQSSLRLMQEQAADKQSRLRARIGDEDIRIQESAAKIKNIISDLEKENIKIDLQKSWFALDNEQFIVDWKKMPQELYDTFKAKYLRPNGWGYYYGPVQVTGRGIFLDYSSLTR